MLVDAMNSSIHPNLSDIIYRNLTSSFNKETIEMIHLYFKFELSSVVILILFAAVTIPTNILLLAMIWTDPLKCFKKPTTPFIVGLAIADLVTGLTTEPFFAIYYYFRYKKAGFVSSDVINLYRSGQYVSTVAISSSFLIVLALSWSQFIAVTFPHRYGILVTRRRVTICVIMIWLYFAGFSLLQFTKIDMMTYLRVDLILHPTLISLLLLITMVFLYRSFQNEIKRKKSILKYRNNQERQLRRRSNVERQFTIVTIYLAGIILASALPHVAVQYVYLEVYESLNTHDKIYVSIAMRVRDLLLFLKVALDAFIYAWRLKIYRETLRKIFGRCFTFFGEPKLLDASTELVER